MSLITEMLIAEDIMEKANMGMSIYDIAEDYDMGTDKVKYYLSAYEYIKDRINE